MPRTLGRRRFPPQDIKIAVTGESFGEGIIWAALLLQHLLDQVKAPVKSQTNGPVVRLPTGVAIYLQLHLLLMPAHSDDTPRAGSGSLCLFLFLSPPLLGQFG